MDLGAVYERALAGARLSVDEGVLLWERAPLDALMGLAHRARWRHNPEPVVTWQIDRNVNVTNVCVSGCLFCNFHCGAGASSAYVLDRAEYAWRVEELLRRGGDQLLLQGGLHPGLDLSYYCDLFRWLKGAYPSLRLHALGPAEVLHLSRGAGLSVEETLRRLMASGLDSLPGAGAEILSERARRLVSPRKLTGAEWLSVMRVAHGLDLPTSATMMYGHVETIRERVEHLAALRAAQDSARRGGHRGFTAFIAWPVQRAGTRLARRYPGPAVSPGEHLRLVALSRLMLDNIAHIQASWLTVGVDVAVLSLRGGADDMGSIMLEERVVRSAGCDRRLDAPGMVGLIREAGFRPALRDQVYGARRGVFPEWD